eukprot:346614_1
MVSVFGKADSTWNDDSERTFSRDPVHSSKRRLSISSHMKTMSMNTAQISPEPPKHALKHPRRKLSDTVQTPPPKRRKLSEFEARWSEEDGDDDINHVVHRIDPSEDEQKGDFVLLQGTRHKFMMCKTMKIYSIAEDGSVEQLMNCGFKDMNSDALYTDLLCLPYQHSRSRSMFTIIADDTHAEAHNDRLRCKIPIKQIIRLYYSLKDHVFQVGEKEIVNCIASLSQSNESDKEKEKALKAIKVDESLYVKLKKTAHHVSQKKQNQTQVKDKTTKAKATVPAKKKSIKETYNLPFECVNKHKKASGIFCVFCGTTVALSDMIRHQSLHFVKEDDNDDDTTDETTTTTPTFTFAVPQPTLQYYIDDGCLKVRSLAEPIELRGDECGICYSKCCRRIVVRTSKASRSKAETLKAFSECPLNFNYNYRSASVSSISNPVVNVPVNCPQENCDFMPYKYLLNEHMKRCHQTTANMSLTTEQLQQHNDRLKADMKREFKGEVLCDKPPSSNKNTNDKGKRATKERAAAKYSCE